MSKSSDEVPDAIEKRIFLRAPRTKVWHALTDRAHLGKWFHVAFAGTEPLAPGLLLTGKVLHPDYQSVVWKANVETVQPETLLTWRWHPYGIDPKVDYAREPKTLVTFTLADAAGGTDLTVVESGFAGVPLERRAMAFRMDEQGWTAVVAAIGQDVEG